jgi:hypothetical protein
MSRNAMLGGVAKRRIRAVDRAVKEAKRTAGTHERADAVERELTGSKRPFLTRSSKPTHVRGVPKKRPTVVEKALGKHGSKGRKRAARKA